MKRTHIATSLLLLAAIASPAYADDAAKTREQVKAELREAIRSGDVLANGDSGLKMNELYPHRYPRVVASAAVPATSRAEVVAETREAIRTGDMYAAGEAAMRLNEEYPQRYGRQRASSSAKSSVAAAPASAPAL